MKDQLEGSKFTKDKFVESCFDVELDKFHASMALLETKVSALEIGFCVMYDTVTRHLFPRNIQYYLIFLPILPHL